MKKKMYIIIVSFFLIAGICYCLKAEGKKNVSQSNKLKLTDIDLKESNENPAKTQDADQNIDNTEEKLLLVHVCGAVKSPGVYRFEEGARIIEGIEAAGGFLDTAAFEYLNLAQKMTDEQRIYVPTAEEAANGSFEAIDITASAAETDEQGRININTASADKLTELKGIGAKKAESIVRYRESNGLFKNTNELLNVEGIGESLYKSLTDSITI